MNSDKIHNKLVNKDRIDQCTFNSTDYRGDLEPNDIFAIGLAATQGTHSGLKQWLLEDTEIDERVHLDSHSTSLIMVRTQRATYTFSYDEDDYTWTMGLVPLECKTTAHEFRVDLDEIPDPVLEAADDKLSELIEVAKK